MISRGFAAKDITNIVLKFGDNRDKGRGVKFLENIRKSPITEKTENTIKMIFRRSTAEAMTNIMLKFGDNRLKGRGQFGGILESLITGGVIKMILRGFAEKDHYKHHLKSW